MFCLGGKIGFLDDKMTYKEKKNLKVYLSIFKRLKKLKPQKSLKKLSIENIKLNRLLLLRKQCISHKQFINNSRKLCNLLPKWEVWFLLTEVGGYFLFSCRRLPILYIFEPGLPDFSCYKTYQNGKI
jgi:hypothetical protein